MLDFICTDQILGIPAELAGEVVALTVARNTASWGLMERLGMRRREDLDFENADFDAEDPTIIVYSIDPQTWEHSR